MKSSRFLCLFIIILLASSNIKAQIGGVRIETPPTATLMLWTNSMAHGVIKIYYNGRYMGTITQAYSSKPECNAYGCVTFKVEGSRNIFRAYAKDGTEWTSDIINLSSTGCNTLLLSNDSVTKKSDTSTDEKSPGTKSGGGNITTTSDDGETIVSTDDQLSEAAAIAGVVVLATAVVIVAAVSNDIYVSKSESSAYNGYSVGFKNTTNNHIDVEYGMTFNKKGGSILKSGFETGYIGNSDKNLNTINFAFVYNFIGRGKTREPIFNPYAGIAFSSCVNDDFARSGVGALAGFSIGRQLKLHIRYKWLKNFEHDLIFENQIEVGLSFRYQKGIFFK